MQDADYSEALGLIQLSLSQYSVCGFVPVSTLWAMQLPMKHI